MEKQSPSQRSLLLDASRSYYRSLADSVAAEVLARRGLLENAREYGLGYVEHPEPTHEKYQGMLSIPYIRYPIDEPTTVASIRFRCIQPECSHHGHGKYNTVEGDTGRLYNTAALQGDNDIVGLAEGELDAITATLCGIQTVGVPGATAWKPHWTPPFLGFETVYVFADGDTAGMKFAADAAKKLPNARIVMFDPGEDVNSTYAKYGERAILERL